MGEDRTMTHTIQEAIPGRLDSLQAPNMNQLEKLICRIGSKRLKLIGIMIAVITAATIIYFSHDNFGEGEKPTITAGDFYAPINQSMLDELQRNLSIHLSPEYKGNITIYMGDNIVFRKARA